MYAKVGKRTLRLADVRYFFRELVEPLSYKYPLLLSFDHALSSPQVAKIPFVSVFCEVCKFLVLTERRFLKFCFKEVTSLNLVHFYVVMLLKYCLVLLVVALN
jgi:hypothetical protein